MIVIKYIVLMIAFITACIIGILFSKKYSNRVKDLKEIRQALNIFETKIKFTCEPIPNTFLEIATQLKPNIAEIFKTAADHMEYTNAGNAWRESVTVANTNMTKEDIQIIKGLGKLLGKTDIEGQVCEIEQVNTFLDSQITNAEQEKNSNEKIYKTLGVVVGLAIVVVLI